MTSNENDKPFPDTKGDAYSDDLLVAKATGPVSVLSLAVSLSEITGIDVSTAQTELEALVARLLLSASEQNFA
ncbi:MAG: hypothetical protein AAF829_11830 [Pseudomonadota bacterium]